MKINLRRNKVELEQVQQQIQEKIQEDERCHKAFENEMEDLYAKMEVIQNRIREITNDNELLSKRIQTKTEDGNKKQEEKGKLLTEIDELKSEINMLTLR